MNNNFNWDFWVDHTSLLEDREENLKRVPKRYYFIFNAYTNDFEYLSSSFTKFTGYDSLINIEHFLNFIHPDDVQYCADCELKIIKFLNQLYFEDNFKFSTEYSYRIKTSLGDYIFIRQKYQALEVDNKGFMSKSIVFHELLPNDYVRQEDDFIIYDRVKNRPVISQNIYNFTNREWEIVDMIVEGLSSKEISLKMNLSEYTIGSHRKNILSKSNSSTFLELSKKLKYVF